MRTTAGLGFRVSQSGHRAQTRRRLIRVIVLVQAAKESERGFLPTAEMRASMEAMGQFNEKLINARIMKAGNCDGLKPSSEGKPIGFDGRSRQVINGPFPNSRELVAGLWL